ncbi:saccharopine dehydrogenase NADP-binding domain-containing protein [Actinokineospora fastidiosa]|uniref:Epimerase n=1 Tax=Actinokineospora fastidiosa TaxID=1816 RepID=A0A918GCC8_9PSEU|nr:saccharopine dehydrogenase NADP-binding domain-containing protein [Actinokineospora fastidiosa]GGS29390.1 epimerase [Actinokineospora fastidiosa]
MSASVAVLGAAGLVGRAAVGMLRELGVGEVRAGFRRTPPRDGFAEPVHVDADDPVSLARFCADADLVLNCAGPSYLLLDRVARAALAAGAHYVDVSGDQPAYHLLAGSDPGTCVVLSAGMLPGLANLVPRVLAAGDSLAGAELVVHAGGIERFGRASAGDLVLSVDSTGLDSTGLDSNGHSGHWYGEALAAWRDGRPVSGALAPAEDVELPHFPGRVGLMPFLTADSARLARTSGLAALDWFNVFTGTRLRPALTRLRGRVPRDPAALDAAVDELMAAGEVDRAGQDPYYLMAFTLCSGTAGRTAVLKTGSSFELTAATAALTVRAVVNGEIPRGLHYADDVLHPEATLQGVRDLGALPVFDVRDHERGATVIEEGLL